MMRQDHRVTELFERAIVLPERERRAFIERETKGDTLLRHELISLVAHHRDDTFVGKSTGGLFPSARSDLVAVRRRRRLWAGWLGLACVLAAATGLLVVRIMTEKRQRELSEELTLTLDAGVAAVRDWQDGWRDELEQWARDPRVVRHTRELVALAGGRDVSGESLYQSAAHRALKEALAPLGVREGVQGINLTSRDHVMIFDSDEELDSVHRLSPEGAAVAAPVFLGRSVVTAPFPAGRHVVAVGVESPEPSRRSLTVVVVPVLESESGDVIAILGIRLLTEPLFSRMLATHRVGEESDTYAFDENALMISASQYPRLHELGLVAAEDDPSTFLVSIRDPGGDLSAGFTPTSEPSTWPLTRMARAATSGHAGVDVQGYPDFRGRRVIGAWEWLDGARMGIAVELSHSEAFARVTLMRNAFLLLTAALGLGSLVFAGYSVSASRLRKQRSDERPFGEYVLEQAIGEGGMATVFRARHQSLERPVAIKIVKGPVSEDAGPRFEREARLIGRLSHPNTIRIYDFGRSEDGSLFYAMELVRGIHLGRLVASDGALPPARGIAILRQIAGALVDAHEHGIVHRDVKPSNIMLGDLPEGADFVKVLDFGLARALTSTTRITQQGLLGGTPVYIAPERVENPERLDPRSDIYSFGAVAFYLLTGREIVDAGSPSEVLLQTVRVDVPPPSTHAPGLDSELDALVHRCLARSPDRRPAHLAEVLETLDRLAAENPWPRENAQAWWRRYWSETPAAG